MKTMKRIVAVFLAVMLIAAIGVVGASAAGEKLTLTLSESRAEGFSFNIYKVASLDTTTGKYTPVNGLASSVVSAIGTANATLLDKLDAAAAGTYGTLVGELAYNGTLEITEPGIYYAKVNATPDNTTLMNNGVIVWPQADGDGNYTLANATQDLSPKVNSGTDNITKAFDDGSKEKAIGEGDVVKFVLTADVVGSTDQKATEYVIWDKMSPGLTYNGDMKVYYDDSTTESTGDFTIAVTDNNENDAHYGGGKYFTITAKAATLSGNGFYSHNKVRVEYSATLNNSAKVSPDYNPNKDGLTYNTGNGQVNKNGDEVKVYTYLLKIKKTIGDTTNGLNGPTFDLKKGNTVIASGVAQKVDNVDGIVEFYVAGDTTPVKLAPGSYTVVETSTIAGYGLNSNPYTVTIADTRANTSTTIAPAISVPNYPTKLPETGGMGTMMFTIIGGCLVLAAGVMFVIIMKKKSSSK